LLSLKLVRGVEEGLRGGENALGPEANDDPFAFAPKLMFDFDAGNEVGAVVKLDCMKLLVDAGPKPELPALKLVWFRDRPLAALSCCGGELDPAKSAIPVVCGTRVLCRKGFPPVG
jgi:hypothetical protein